MGKDIENPNEEEVINVHLLEDFDEPDDNFEDLENPIDDGFFIEDEILDEDNIDFYEEPEDIEEDADEVFEKKEHNKRVGNIIRRTILIISIAIFCFSAYKLLGILLEYKEGNDIYKSIANNVENNNDDFEGNINGEDIVVPFKYDHNALLAINPDALGYIYVPSIDLRLPFVQSHDNEEYLSTTINGVTNSNGCPFLDCNITGGMSAMHLIIYGHTLYSNEMFSKLHSYSSSDFYSSEDNDKFFIYTEDKLKEYRIFSVNYNEPISATFSYNFSSQSSMRNYAQTQKELSIYSTPYDVSEATQIVSLVTCADGGNTRLVVQGVYVGETTISD